MLSKYRKTLILLHDLIAVILIWYFAFMLRYNFYIPPTEILTFFHSVLILAPLHLVVAYFLGLHRATWRYSSLENLQDLIILAVTVTLLISSIVLMLRLSVPRSVLVMYPILSIASLGGSRFLYRYLKENNIRSVKSVACPIIVFGAGAAGAGLVKDFKRSSKWDIVAFLDDNELLHGRALFGIPIFGGLSKLKDVERKFGAKTAVIAIPSAPNIRKKQVLDEATRLGLNVLTVPSIEDLISGRVAISQIRPIEVEDLLGRDTVELENSGLQKLIEGCPVLVSGAGGSIGSELCRQILKFKPSHLICFDLSEYALYQLEQELGQSLINTRLVYVVGDVRNATRLDKLFAKYRPKVVFHAAAYKHVPLMENENVAEAFSNNVIGTYTLANAAKKAKAEKFVMVSTDKAVNPTNVMGATKRLAEMVCQGLQDKKGTRFLMVRFGNVLGSSGSVIPKFRQQIAAGGPITVTHPEITRYFMSIPEAAQLVMQAGLMGLGGEIFVLDMGEPVRIVDLAKDMIKLSGLQEDEIAIEFTGLRPGEKLYEELLADDEHTLPTPHEKLRIASARDVDGAWVDSMLEWIATTLDKDELIVKRELKKWVEEYSPDLTKQ